jgi:epoxyqueuosine reductase
MPDDQEIIRAALKRARDLGADVAGAVPAARLINCPSAVADGYQGSQRGRGTYIILGLHHDPEHPDLDLWEEGRGTPGDRILAGIGRRLGLWLQENYGARTEVIPYQIQDGGIYLKDAACLAGIGRMGRNNLVLVPGYGPRIRFRAVWTDLTTTAPDLPLTGGYDIPCVDCAGPCISACPMEAFATGRYSRDRCMARMDADKTSGRERIDHCRACELACPAWDGG